MVKVAAPNMACRVIDWAIQAFGGAGVTGRLRAHLRPCDGAYCGWPTAPARCIGTRSPASNCANTRAEQA
jgi:alkylation response protein AidB-like acyl-CoA dehydrogenase